MLRPRRRAGFSSVIAGCAVAALMVGAGINNAAAAQPIVIRLSVDNPPGSPRAIGEKDFANLVEKLSHGRMKVEIFWSGSLGGVQRAAIDTVRAGGAEMGAISTSNFSEIDRTWSMFDMPFLFTGPHGLYKYMASPEFAALKRQTAKRDGVHYVFSWYDSWRQLVTTKRPIHTPSQMNGIKLRTTGSPVETAYDVAFGAKPTAVSWGETYLALKNGLVDGYFIGYTTITNFKQDDAVKYGTTLNIVPIVVPMFMSESFYKKLPPSMRKVLDEAGRKAELIDQKLTKENETASIKQLHHEGFVIYNPPPSVKAEWVAKAKPVYAKFGSAFPKGMIASVKALQ